MHYHVSIGQEGGYLPFGTWIADTPAEVDDLVRDLVGDEEDWESEGDPQVGFVLTPPGAGPNTLNTIVDVQGCMAYHDASVSY